VKGDKKEQIIFCSFLFVSSSLEVTASNAFLFLPALQHRYLFSKKQCNSFTENIISYMLSLILHPNSGNFV